MWGQIRVCAFQIRIENFNLAKVSHRLLGYTYKIQLEIILSHYDFVVQCEA